MSNITPNMGLVRWNESGDPYDHTQLSGNWTSLDEHNHTSGKGVQIPTGGIVNEAIIGEKIANETIGPSKLEKGAVTPEKLSKESIWKIGDLKYWWRPNNLTPVPGEGWVVAEGQALGPTQHEFAGGGTVTLPNLIDVFPYGVKVENLGSSGGQSTININHSHTVLAHEHSIAPHTHGLNLESGFGAATNLKISQNLEGSAWTHTDDHSGAEHRHPINGNANYTTLVTEAATSSTDSRLNTSQSIIPPWVGLLPLIKVLN